jgi:hypothetical protein
MAVNLSHNPFLNKFPTIRSLAFSVNFSVICCYITFIETAIGRRIRRQRYNLQAQNFETELLILAWAQEEVW